MWIYSFDEQKRVYHLSEGEVKDFDCLLWIERNETLTQEQIQHVILAATVAPQPKSKTLLVIPLPPQKDREVETGTFDSAQTTNILET